MHNEHKTDWTRWIRLVLGALVTVVSNLLTQHFTILTSALDQSGDSHADSVGGAEVG